MKTLPYGQGAFIPIWLTLAKLKVCFYSITSSSNRILSFDYDEEFKLLHFHDFACAGDQRVYEICLGFACVKIPVSGWLLVEEEVKAAASKCNFWFLRYSGSGEVGLTNGEVGFTGSELLKN